MDITLDIEGANDKKTLFERFSEILIHEKWGHNWEALNDCLRDFSTGGFTKKFESPLFLSIVNWQELKEKNPQVFKDLKDILDSQVQEHHDDGYIFKYVFSEGTILAHQNYTPTGGAGNKHFYEKNFLDIETLYSIMFEVDTGETALLRDGYIFLEKQYGLENISKILSEKGGLESGNKTPKEILNWLKFLKEDIDEYGLSM